MTTTPRNLKRPDDGTGSRSDARPKGNGKKRATIRKMRAQLAKRPEDYQTRLALAERTLERGRADEAIELLAGHGNDFRSSDSVTAARVVRTLAFSYTAIGRFDEARVLIETHAQSHPWELDFHYLLAYIGQKLKSVTLSERHGRQYLVLLEKYNAETCTDGLWQTATRRYEVHNYLGAAMEESGRYDDAEECYRQSVKSRRSFDLGWVNLIRVLLKTGQKQKARETLALARRAASRSELLSRVAIPNDVVDPDRPTITLCMIVRNEEENLPRCLNSVRDLVDQIIVVDTGSTDRTVEIAKSFGAEVHHHKWEGDFSKARNISMGYADCDWILIMDADEELAVADFPLIRRSVAENDFRLIAITVYNYSEQAKAHTSFLPSIRLVRRDLGAYYDGIVHNQLRYAKEESVLRIPAKLYHYGYGLGPEAMARKIARSEALLEKQLTENPDHGFAHFNMAQLIRGTETDDMDALMDRVIFHAERAVELSSPDDPTERHIHVMALLQLVTAHMNKKQYEQAVECAHRALELKPDFLDALLSLGHIHALQNDSERARKYYLEYLKAQSAYQEHAETDHIILLHLRSRHNALYGLGVIDLIDGKMHDAADWFKRCIAERNDYLDAHARLGVCYAAIGNAEAAEREYRTELELHPDNVDARRALLGLFEKQGNFDAMRTLLTSQPEGTVKEWAMTLRLAQLELEAGHADTALSLCDDFDPADAERPEVIQLRADVLYAGERWNDAATAYETCRRISPENVDVLNNLGNCRFQLEDFDAAATHYQSVIDAGGAEPLTYRNLGLTLARQEKTEDAIFVLESYVEMVQSDIECEALLGDLHTARGNLVKAIDHYECVAERQPERVPVLIRLADCYLHQGALRAALTGYEAALKVEPDNTEAWDRLKDLRAYLVAQQDSAKDNELERVVISH